MSQEEPFSENRSTHEPRAQPGGVTSIICVRAADGAAGSVAFTRSPLLRQRDLDSEYTSKAAHHITASQRERHLLKRVRKGVSWLPVWHRHYLSICVPFKFQTFLLKQATLYQC